jgi:AcrR family transcriptional regulator
LTKPFSHVTLNKSKRIHFLTTVNKIERASMMDTEQEAKWTRKGELTRQHILTCALHLFGTKGYEETTMRDIAAEAGYSPGLAYRYFSSKEELVLGLYQNLCDELENFSRDLAPATLPERFRVTVTRQLELMTPHREALSALFGLALNPRSKAGVFSENTADIRRHGRGTYLAIILGAKDAPKLPFCEDLATLLYGVHLAMVLFWLIDESKLSSRSHLFLAFLCDLLKMVQPILWLPLVSHMLTRLAAILGPLLGDDRHTSPPIAQEQGQP